MHALLDVLVKDFSLSGDLREDTAQFLKLNECPNTAIHCQQVGDTAAALAAQFEIAPQQAALAGWLHDISAVFPNAERIAVSQALGIDILPEEAEVPLLLHQKISAVMAEQIFEVDDPQVLSAIGCHTTLKATPTPLDTLVFVADKIRWDQKGTPPYAEALQSALTHSIEKAAWVYQDYLWHSGKMKIVHPWMLASYQELKAVFSPPA